MKKMKRRVALLVAAMLVMAMNLSVFAAPDSVPAPGTGTITIHNAGIGEEYTIYKVLDASVGANNAIVYPGPVPAGLEDCFEVGADGVNLQVKSGLSESELFSKLKEWAENASPTGEPITATSSTVEFTGLAFGYYVVVSSMDSGAVISVTSTTPNAVTYEKNSTIPQPVKTASNASYFIGDTVEYTVTFPGANYMQPADNPGEGAKIVTKYVVTDTLPEYLSDTEVTGISIGGNAMDVTENNFPGVTSFGTSKTFDIPWADLVDDAYVSKYANGVEVEITYTATVTSTINVNGSNKNRITVTTYVDGGDGEPVPWEVPFVDDCTISTYAAALVKKDGQGENAKELPGAKFKFKGLTVAGTKGVYTVVSYDPDSQDLGTEMEVGADGKLYIIGLAEDSPLTGEETVAPAGYNLLKGDVTVTAQILEEEVITESGTRYYDADGNLLREESQTSTSKTVEKNLSDLDADAIVVVNQKGTELPATGGMGTTLFYIIGSILVIGAGIVLVAKKRMNV